LVKVIFSKNVEYQESGCAEFT